MNKEIQDYQDNMVASFINAKKFNDQSDIKLAVIKDEMVVPIENLLKSIAKMTTREDLKERIEKALNE